MIILLTLMGQALAQDVATTRSSDAKVSMDNVVDKLLNELLDRVSAAPIARADLDRTTLAKPGTTLAKPMMTQGITPAVSYLACKPAPAVQSVQTTLRMYGVPSSPMERFALTSIGATRDVSLKAQIKPAFDCMDRQTQKNVILMSEAVEEKAEEKAEEAKAEDAEKAEGTEETKAEEKPKGKIDLKEMAGVTSFPGFWDPAGFSTDIPDGKLMFYREAELKHGRVGMIASLGIVVGEVFHPFFGGQDHGVSKDLFTQNVEIQIFWVVALLAMGALEVPRLEMIEGGEIKATDALPGDLGFDPLGLKPKDAKELKIMQDKELNNGRLAMLAAAGMIAQELYDGKQLFPIHGQR